MKMDINKLAEYLTNVSINIEGIYRFTHKPGKTWPKYTEPFAGFIFPLSGRLEFIFNGESYIFEPGKVIHGGARMDLLEGKIETEEWEYLLVLYDVKASDNEDTSISSSHFELEIGNSQRLYDLLERLWKVSFQSGGIPAFQTKVLFYNVIEEVFTCVRNQDKDSSKELFKSVSKYIHEHYNDELTILNLAKQNNVNRNRLFYVFKKYAGIGPGEYIVRYRLNRAREILMVENLLIQEISEVVGFNDSFYFSRAFKKQFGFSPTEYRKKLINNPV
ncbi:helix-turn-helix domain protein [Clostridium argentinense CDC 2741]|uniref:Helix-turn-helix domain protein n=1 Tax=Clostridium argentinense CDC 2741 TaxID=1418104 RepID=A0A0C1U852_9CLOT|nr:AraC family transcriptional regulator [Clostridium argentinense]ARC86147.1 AraC family transcriptional regulator [Clostridium argentinense]KIE47928.1 helix-turn-helix domain protein [Clostridium argentinense CDC 2741]